MRKKIRKEDFSHSLIFFLFVSFLAATPHHPSLLWYSIIHPTLPLSLTHTDRETDTDKSKKKKKLFYSSFFPFFLPLLPPVLLVGKAVAAGAAVLVEPVAVADSGELIEVITVLRNNARC